MLPHTSLWLQWLLCVTVTLKWLITLHLLLIWHRLTISVPQHKNPTWLGSSTGPFMRSFLQLRTFSRMNASIQRESKRCNTDGRNVWTAGETMLKNKPHLVQFDHWLIVSLWNFQPTLVRKLYKYCSNIDKRYLLLIHVFQTITCCNHLQKENHAKLQFCISLNMHIIYHCLWVIISPFGKKERLNVIFIF